MVNAQVGTILRQVRRLIGAPIAADCTDGQLLERFVAKNDEAAFTELVRRLGPMVLGVCRRVLGNEQDIEDAFQAAFLLLAAKGGSIRQREAVGGWLYEVTHRLALKTKATAARRRLNERLAAAMLNTDSVPDSDWQELRIVLDEELQRLPEKYRTPLVLCYLEGKTHEQAARELGWPVGSMSRNLARAKERLRERVAHRGVLLSTGLLFTLLVENAPAAVAARLVTSTVKAATLFAAGNTAAAGLISTQALALAKEMIQAMFLTRLKLTAVLTLIISVLGIGGGALLQQAVNSQATAADAPILEAAAEDQSPATAGQAAGKDAHGDPLPPGALIRLGTLRFRHAGPITFVAFPPDGKTVLTASRDGTIRLWELDTGKEIRRFEKPQGQAVAPVQPAQGRNQVNVRGVPGMNLFSLALSPDGKTLAVPIGAAIQLFEVSTGKELREIKATVPASLLVFSPDSKTLAGRAADRTIYLWEADSGKEIRQIKTKQAAQPRVGFVFVGGVYGSSASLVFSPDGKTLAMDDMQVDNQKINVAVRLVEVDTGKDIRQIKIEQNGFSGIAFSPDGKVLAYGSGNAIHLCQADNGNEIRKIGGLDSGISALVFAPGGKTLGVKGMRDPVIHLCDVESGKNIRQFGGQPAAAGQVAVFGWGGAGAAHELAFSPDGKLVAAGGGNALRLFEAASGKELAQSSGHRGPVTVLAIAADGKTIVSMGADNTIRRWDATSGKEMHQFAMPTGTTCLAFSPDARIVAFGNAAAIFIHDVATGKEMLQLKGHTNGIGAVGFSPDGKTLASRGGDNTIRLYDVVKGSELKQINLQAEIANPNPGGAIMRLGFGGSLGLVFSPDGKMVASAGAGGNAVAQVVINNGGVMGRGNTINLWSVTTGKVVRTITLPQQRSAVSMAFSPDGRVLATENADRTISLWEIASGKERGQLGQAPGAAGQPGVARAGVMVAGGFVGAGAAPSAHTLAFSPDGRTLAARSADHSVRVWDVAAAKELHQFKGHQGAVAAVAFAADGKSVASGSDDTTILIWDVSRLSPSPKPPPIELSAQDVESLWTDLAGDDGVKAFQSIQKMATSPKQVVSLLQERLKPAAPLDQQKIDQFIKDLDSERFTARDQANQELEKLGERAIPALEKVLASQPSLETRKRAEQLLEKLSGKVLTAEQVRLVRAVEVLEQTGTSEARRQLETLAKGAPGALPTREAQAALSRLAKPQTSDQ